MHSPQHIRTDQIPGLMSITLAQPEKKNALDDAMYRALTTAFARADADPTVRVVLLTAEGDDFCAGNDIAEFLAMSRSGDLPEPSAALGFLHALAAFGKPIVSAVRGHALGIGMTMLLHCDLVYVAEDARLSAPFVDLALTPEAASSLLLPARVGHARAFAMFVLGESLDGRAAVECGLANAALPGDRVAACAHAAALTLASKPAQAVQSTRRLMREQGRLRAVIDSEARVFRERLLSAEAQAVLQAFATRRRPGA